MKTTEKYCSEILKKERFNPADAENDIKIRRLEYLVLYLAKKLDENGQKQAGIGHKYSLECDHNWHHIDNHSDRMYCIKCDKRI